ncbi:hypothetical protein [Nonomuraea sp. LPB2021202275-12-8]|uniref:hypothetical protein n=1 Tax=Nonomuraea sp. LPB2021202275-12-8 TaxID=3120159 RepID=UPI00300C1F06
MTGQQFDRSKGSTRHERGHHDADHPVVGSDRGAVAQRDRATGPADATVSAAVESFLSSLTAATTRTGYTETISDHGHRTTLTVLR